MLEKTQTISLNTHAMEESLLLATLDSILSRPLMNIFESCKMPQSLFSSLSQELPLHFFPNFNTVKPNFISKEIGKTELQFLCLHIRF